MNPQDASYVQSMIAQATAGLLPPDGYTREKAWDPSTGVGLVKAGNRDAFFYPTGYGTFLNGVTGGATTLGVAGTQTSQINIAADADFYCTHFLSLVLNHAALTNIAYGATPIANAELLPLVTVLITDTGSSRQLMQNPVPIPLIAGSGRMPYRLQFPRLFQRTTSINFAFTNFDSALSYDGWFILGGFKVYSNT